MPFPLRDRQRRRKPSPLPDRSSGQAERSTTVQRFLGAFALGVAAGAIAALREPIPPYTREAQWRIEQL